MVVKSRDAIDQRHHGPASSQARSSEHRAEDVMERLAKLHNEAQKKVRPDIQLATSAVIQLETELRRIRAAKELPYFLANAPRTITGAQQICVMDVIEGRRFEVLAISSISVINRASAVVQWFETLMRRVAKTSDIADVIEIDRQFIDDTITSLAERYPLQSLLWMPLQGSDGKTFAGLLLARQQAWCETDRAVAGYLAGAFAHTWQALHATRPMRLRTRLRAKKWVLLSALALAAALCVPVPMSVLAPVEVVPKTPFIVTSGVRGVIDEVNVKPSQVVKAGDIVIRLNDITFANRYVVAEREVGVAKARYKKAMQLAFREARGRQELAVRKAELDVARADYDYAKAMLDQTLVRAGQSGVAVFSAPEDLIGKPVDVGERLLAIADPNRIEFRIDLAVADAIALRENARVKVFLDSKPLAPVEAKLVRASYRAQRTEENALAFHLVAEPVGANGGPVRLGLRGTAQVFSDTVPLAFYLFRRPLSAARQWIGI